MPSAVRNSAVIAAKSVEPVMRFANANSSITTSELKMMSMKRQPYELSPSGMWPTIAFKPCHPPRPCPWGMPPKSMIENVTSSLVSGGCVFS